MQGLVELKWIFIQNEFFILLFYFFIIPTDYDTLRALDTDNATTTQSMTDEEINALPVHKYKVNGQEK